MTKTTDTLLAELIAVTKDWNCDDDIGREHKSQCIRIGNELNQLGGFDLMLKVCYAANRHNRVVANNLNFIWHGIGDWRM